MKPTSALLGLLGLTATASASSAATEPLSSRAQSLRRDYDGSDYYVLHLDPETAPEQVALRLGLSHEGQLGELKDHHVFSGQKSAHDVVKRELQLRKRRKRDAGAFLTDRSPLDGIRMAQKQVVRAPWEKRVIPPAPAAPGGVSKADRDAGQADEAAVKKQSQIATDLEIRDPIFNEQWHLFNPVQVGHDVNVTGLWLEGITGKNTTVAIVDDGLDMYSDDLKDNFYAKGSYDFNDQTDEPKPRLSDDRHGTRCAGEVSAVRNNVCGVGVAYDSRIAGLRILSKPISDADEALAMNYDFDNNQIYSCSWGPPDDGRSMDAPGLLIRRAMLNAVQNGRGGLGSIYVFASGNGAGFEDNCNFDGYTNSIYSITVGAIDRHGAHPYYSEKCSASLVVTYSSGGGDAIHTTDVGQNACYNGHGGTSAAAPLAAGIFALALQVRPDLTWRDMQYLAMLTAVPVNLDSGEWQDTYMGKKYSHTFAYGKVDSYGLVEAAKTWQKVKPQAWYFSPWIHVRQAIPEGDVGLAVSVEVTEDMLKQANLARIEHVTVTMNVAHKRRGDLSVDLISPQNVVSHLSATRKMDDIAEGYVDWTFMSVVHWGEPGVGKWTLLVKDTIVNGKNGTLTDFHLKLWGESIDAAKAQLLPMPTEDEDNDHDLTATTTLAASTTTLSPTSTAAASSHGGSVVTKPADHPDRPVKPTATTAAVTSVGGGGASTTGAASPAKPTDGEKEATGDETAKPSSSPSSANDSVSWLPHFMQNLSTRTQIWIYGAIGLITAFCCGLGIYLYMARRRRLRNNPRDNYEFELVDEEEGEALNGGDGEGGGGGVASEKGRFSRGGRGARRKTRGGELYDAFADGSEDDEDEDEDVDAHHHDGGHRGAGDNDSLVSDSEGRDDNAGYSAHRQQAYRDGSDERLMASKAAPAGRAQNLDQEHYVIGDDSGSE